MAANYANKSAVGRRGRDGPSRVPWPGVCVLRFKEGGGWVMELLEKNFDMREVEGV